MNGSNVCLKPFRLEVFLTLLGGCNDFLEQLAMLDSAALDGESAAELAKEENLENIAVKLYVKLRGPYYNRRDSSQREWACRQFAKALGEPTILDRLKHCNACLKIAEDIYPWPWTETMDGVVAALISFWHKCHDTMERRSDDQPQPHPASNT